MKRKYVLVTLTAVLILAGLVVLPARAGLFDTEIKLTGSDTQPDDYFGVSVATNGNKAIVGAHRDKDAGNYSGAAYLFNVGTGAELFKLTASDAGLGHQFGFSVAISGNMAIVGSHVAKNELGISSGAAYLFDVTTGNELRKLTAFDSEVGNIFGSSVAISGDVALVGAAFDSDGGHQSGSAYLFDVTSGQTLHKLTASDAAPFDVFGSSVAISGDIAIVGANGDDDKGNRSGAAYLFDVTTGNELFKLTASDGSALDFFGGSVAISGDIAIVGSTGNNNAVPGSGAAYVFDVNTGVELFKLSASDAATDSGFGTSLAINGNTAVIGALVDNVAGLWSGAAYLFDVTTGQELLKLIPSDASERDYFGGSVAISGNTLVIGANDDGNAGKAYIFRNSIVPEPSSFLLAVLGMSVLGLRGTQRG